MIDLIGKTILCKYYDQRFKSEAGLMNHRKRRHPLDLESGWHCWTYNIPFTKTQLLYQHYQTVLHQINCKKITEGEIPEKSTENKEAPLVKDHKNQQIEGLTEQERKNHTLPLQEKRQKLLKNWSCNNSLKNSTMPQTDQRRDPIISFIDASDLLDEEMTTTVPTT